ncbi:MAG TPA: hypothetical protein EYP10_08635 [Armatimonadetes bacterium]|nr:hypothetical protein [Armatimonadota bacterium]
MLIATWELMRRRRRRGLTLVLFVLVIVVLMLMLALAIEWGRLTRARTEMQQWCDASALAGAADLPNATQAKRSAAEYYARNLGLDPADYEQISSDGNTTTYRIGTDEVAITTPYEDDTIRSLGISPEYAIRVCSSRQVELYLGRLAGVQVMTVSACATAIFEQAGGAYVLFNNSQTTPLTITGSAVLIDGSVHTNQDLIVRGSSHRATGTTTVVGRATITGSNHSFDIQNVSVQDRPQLPTSLTEYRQQAQQNGQLIIGRDYHISQANFPEGVVYVEGGNITAQGHAFNRNVTLIAVRRFGRGGHIRVVGSSWTLRASDNVLLFYGDRGVELHGYNNSVYGIIYAPNGNVRITGAGWVFRTSVISEGIRIDAHTMRFSLGPNIFGIGGVRLVE